MSVFPIRRDPDKEIQNTAELMFKWCQQLPTPRHAATAMALANTALIWTQRPADEAAVRKLMAETTEVIVTMWKAQVEAAKEMAK